MSQSYWSGLENAKDAGFPSQRVLERLAGLLGVHWKVLLGLELPSEPPSEPPTA